MTACAERTSSIVISSARHSMLLNQKESTSKIVEAVGQLRGIKAIRMYNQDGTVTFSTDSAEIFTKIDRTHEACINCHNNEKPGSVIDQTPEQKTRRFKDETGTRFLGYVTPILNEKSCYTAQCHAHTPDTKVLGVLEVIISMKEPDTILDEEMSDMISNNVIIALIISLSVGIFIWIFVHVPLTRFLIGTKEISSGNLNYKFYSTSKNDEIGTLGKSFNKMTNDLRIAKKEITEWSNELEKRVKEKTEELRKTQERILQIEKMASLGQLSATVAHELNNPMAGILTYSKLIQRKMERESLSADDKATMLKQLKMIESESDRLGKIIKDLLLFSKKQEPEFRKVNLNEVVDMSFQLVAHHLELHNISLEATLQPNLPMVQIDENQIKQMLLALYVNATEAMEKDGVLEVSTYVKQTERRVYLIVKDNGKGIPEDVKPHIFEPFFTTKNAVKGFGLGLSVVYGIVHNHKAEITVESQVSKGTSFIIKFPIKAS
jgi:two-component system NtrC family sensor kinase